MIDRAGFEAYSFSIRASGASMATAVATGDDDRSNASQLPGMEWIGPPNPGTSISYLDAPLPLGLVCVLAFFMQSRPLAPKREIELDFIRGVAILLVLSFHYRSHNRLFFLAVRRPPSVLRMGRR